ncbi:ABC transporter permease subunit [Microbacterium sp. MEC084]|uniref:carbohydrate ABC transporter permease n=1 Tax=Microbacterium sp. MEC084 TaxID=1963027 RepID=UPI00197BCE8B|nr:carbohydrate ABC transporter permease [Microbacterium sp. MEC084]MCD1269986.1 ABC transporter permease subunit [Microbacterium sp. MEC084]
MWLVIGLIPLVFMLVTSVKPAGIVNQVPPVWIFPVTFENFATVLAGGSGVSRGFGALLLNSAIVSIGATVLTVLLAVPAAYALSMRSFGPRKGIASWILSTYMFPPIVAVVPIFVFAGKLGLMDTYPVLIVPYAAFNLPIAIWILRSTIVQIPYEIQEAAMVDGAGQWVILRRVIWPLLAPSVATVAVLTIVLTWNEFLFALSLTRSAAKTAPVGLQEFTGMFGTDWGSITAGATLIVAPILVLTILLRRRMISGLTFGAVK